MIPYDVAVGSDGLCRRVDVVVGKGNFLADLTAGLALLWRNAPVGLLILFGCIVVFAKREIFVALLDVSVCTAGNKAEEKDNDENPSHIRPATISAMSMLNY